MLNDNINLVYRLFVNIIYKPTFCNKNPSDFVTLPVTKSDYNVDDI